MLARASTAQGQLPSDQSNLTGWIRHCPSPREAAPLPVVCIVRHAPCTCRTPSRPPPDPLQARHLEAAEAAAVSDTRAAHSTDVRASVAR
eukprot:7076378-Pyramimonas_sp.AAC.1